MAAAEEEDLGLLILAARLIPVADVTGSSCGCGGGGGGGMTC